MTITWKEIGVIASVVTALSFIVASVIALKSLYINNKMRRTDLLNNLFKKFFYDSKYAEIRKKIDYSSKHEYLMKQLEEALTTRKNEALEEKCVDFFNFFEFIAVLWKLKQLKIIEIKYMFEYYVKMMDNNKHTKNYISLKENGFENLLELIKKINKKHLCVYLIKKIKK
ncbi:MAG: hypothetical protein M1276_02210 [Deltaproteobacteria bacterium]|jgi:hypothetical protein|nr:hypothetical protein [Deltaproteobacteria bacterium]